HQIETIGSPDSSLFSRNGRRRMHRLLQLSCIWPAILRRLWSIWPRLRSRVRRLPRLRHGRGWRSAVLHAWPRVLRRADLLRLEAGTLGMARRTKSLDPRPLRHKATMKRNPPFPVDAAG